MKKKLSKNLSFANFIPDSTLDFHQFEIINHFEIERLLNEFVEDNYINKNKYLLVITGKGNVVRPLIYKLLRQNNFVQSFKQAGYFNGQSGAVEVTLNDY